MDIIKSIEHGQLKKKIPVLNIGDTVRVHVRVKEGNRERIQVFEGTIIKKQGGSTNATFTVRRISYGVGVEKTFLVHSPRIEKIEVTRVGKVRRAKLYYLRDRVGKAAKTKEKVGARIPTDKDYEEVTEEAVAEAVEAEKEEEAKNAENTSESANEVKAEEVKEEVKEEAKVEEKKEEKKETKKAEKSKKEETAE